MSGKTSFVKLKESFFSGKSSSKQGPKCIICYKLGLVLVSIIVGSLISFKLMLIGHWCWKYVDIFIPTPGLLGCSCM